MENQRNPIVIKYSPHGINQDQFFNIDKDHTSYPKFIEFKNKLFNKKEYEFVLLWNSRNIRRKSTSDLMLAYKIFIDSLDEAQASKCVLLLHTQIIDENGTDLMAVKEMLFGNNKQYNIIFSDNRLGIEDMNFLYNCSDVIALVSSNEGWGLSLTEGMMCSRPIIAGVTGGMQDQMRFEDEDGNWISFTESFGSNHRGKYKKCGKWAFPVFPSNISLIGSVPTPFIFDDRLDPDDIATQIKNSYTCGKEYREQIGKLAREWVISDESMMSGKWMCKNIIDGIEETFEKFIPKKQFELINVKTLEQPRHYNKFPIAI